MFAVPGWAVSAEALTRQRPEDVDASGPKSSKKRKRKKLKPVTSEFTAKEPPEFQVQHEAKANGYGAAAMPSRGSPAENARKKRQRVEKPKSRPPPSDGSKNHEHGKYSARETGRQAALPTVVQQTPPPPPDTTARLPAPTDAHTPPAPAPTKLTALQTTMRDKLVSSRFRHLNQTLYTTPSAASARLFAENPAFFDQYHQGFRRQVAAWPENPVDGFVDWVRMRGAARPGKPSAAPQRKKGSKAKDGQPDAASLGEEPASGPPSFEPLPRDNRTRVCTIVDLGCGDAQLARTLTTPARPAPPLSKQLKLRVQSYDLAAASPLVTVADIRVLPLPDGSADVAVFCLALMGTNWVEFVDEAWRVLRWHGECWVAEVSSRFAAPAAASGKKRSGAGGAPGGGRRGAAGAAIAAEEQPAVVEEVTSAPKAGPDVSAFVAVLRKRGFVLRGQPDTSNKMFVRMRFVKAAQPGATGPSSGRGRKWAQDADDGFSLEEAAKVLKPCVYKTR